MTSEEVCQLTDAIRWNVRDAVNGAAYWTTTTETADYTHGVVIREIPRNSAIIAVLEDVVSKKNRPPRKQRRKSTRSFLQKALDALGDET
jgi:hypothetical protein